MIYLKAIAWSFSIMVLPYNFQMALLLLFEKSDNLNYKELHTTTKMSDEQFPRYVQSLIDAKLLTSNTEVNNVHMSWIFLDKKSKTCKGAWFLINDIF